MTRRETKRPASKHMGIEVTSATVGEPNIWLEATAAATLPQTYKSKSARESARERERERER